MSSASSSSAQLDIVPGRALDLLRVLVETRRTNALGHMRAAEYVSLFDDAVMALLPRTGITDDNLLAGETSPFLLELHASYAREVSAGDTIKVSAQALEADAQRVRLMLMMHEAAGDKLAATCELLILNMDLAARRPAPWSASQTALWAELVAAHAMLPIPHQAGRAIGPLTKAKP